jgi:hypothetical protein
MYVYSTGNLSKFYGPFLPKNSLRYERVEYKIIVNFASKFVTFSFSQILFFSRTSKEGIFVANSTCRLPIQNTRAHRRRSIFFRIWHLRLLNRGDGGNTTAAAVTLEVGVGFLRGVAWCGAAAAAVQCGGRVATSRGCGGGQNVAAVRRGPRAAGYRLCARPDRNINILISI